MLPSLNRNLDLFNSFFDDPFFSSGRELKKMENTLMRTDIKEKDGKYIISVELPGYKKDEINLELENGYLTISANKNKEKDEKEDGYIRKERYTGSCSRSFYVGDNISEDNIKAKYKNGMLEIDIPKEEEKKENKKLIDIDED